MQEDMRETWRFIYSEERSFPGPEGYAVCAGSSFWSRADPLLKDRELLAAVPRFLNIWETGYHRIVCHHGRGKAGCRMLYALERVLPTIVHGRSGLAVVE